MTTIESARRDLNSAVAARGTHLSTIDRALMSLGNQVIIIVDRHVEARARRAGARLHAEAEDATTRGAQRALGILPR